MESLMLFPDLPGSSDEFPQGPGTSKILEASQRLHEVNWDDDDIRYYSMNIISTWAEVIASQG